MFDKMADNYLFQSTPSARRATLRNSCSRPDLPISIHALREEGDHFGLHGRTYEGISIHALREEGDIKCYIMDTDANEFQSTPSARRATWDNFKHFMGEVISIHALREEGDHQTSSTCWKW